MLCPIEICTGVQQLFSDDYKNIQHHLWRHHGMDVVWSHRQARLLATPPEPKRYVWKKILHRESEAEVEFKKKQLRFEF